MINHISSSKVPGIVNVVAHFVVDPSGIPGLPGMLGMPPGILHALEVDMELAPRVKNKIKNAS